MSRLFSFRLFLSVTLFQSVALAKREDNTDSLFAKCIVCLPTTAVRFLTHSSFFRLLPDYRIQIFIQSLLLPGRVLSKKCNSPSKAGIFRVFLKRGWQPPSRPIPNISEFLSAHSFSAGRAAGSLRADETSSPGGRNILFGRMSGRQIFDRLYTFQTIYPLPVKR